MDSNESYETCNRVSKLHIKALTPYAPSLRRASSKRARRMQNYSSLWKEEEEEMVLVRCKKLRRLTETKSEGFQPLGRDTLLRALSLLDISSLIRCSCVDRSLNTLIRSLELRRLWSQNQSLVVLVSSYTLPCKLWQPGSSSPAEKFPLLTWKCFDGAGELENLVARPLPLENGLVVASHRGLVCVRFSESLNDDVGLDLAVGNPLTREWVALPKSQDFGRMTNYKYTMEVADNRRYSKGGYRVHFKVAGFSTAPGTYCYHVFDSATGNWSITSLDFPPRTPFKWSAFDLRSGTWKTELIRSSGIKTGLERSPVEVHRLPHPAAHAFFKWEYEGSSYVASVWTVEQERYHPAEDCAGEFAGYGVWRVQRGTADDGERLESVAAVWARDLGTSSLAIERNQMVGYYIADCTAVANLVCFGGKSERSPTMPVVIYDLKTGRWSVFDEQHPATDEFYWPGHHYAAAVAYAPSLLVAPHRFNS